jgi:fused signal recognition particle receptor
MGLFKKIKSALSKTKQTIGFKLDKLFTGGVLDDDFYDELEMILLSSDIGAEATDEILEKLKAVINKKMLTSQESVREELQSIIAGILEEVPPVEFEYPIVIMVVGVNGVGKTTCIGKMANYFKSKKKSVLIAAADTFRAAACEQLTVWADRADVRIVKNVEGADPSSVVFDAIKSVQAKKTDVLLIDTAGRLHNKVNLMEELKKMSRVVGREYPEASVYNFLALDATTGQNALSQVEYFNDAVGLDGVILTKLDGTAKGGVVIAIKQQFNLPVIFVGVGEKIDDLLPFNAEEFARAIVGIE